MRAMATVGMTQRDLYVCVSVGTLVSPANTAETDLELYKCRLWAHHTLAYVGIRNQVLNGVLTLPQQLVYLLNSIIETTHVNRPEYKQEER